MADVEPFTPNYRPSVVIFSDPGGLAVSLVEKLLANFCRVVVLGGSPEEWESKTTHIEQRSFLEINPKEVAPEYIIFLDIDLGKTSADYEYLFSLYKKNLAKVLVVLPFSFLEKDKEKIDRAITRAETGAEDFGIIFVGDLLGPRVESADGSLAANSILKAFEKGKLLIYRGNFFPINVSDAAKEIAKSLFSFGPFGESLAVVGESVFQEEFFQATKRYLPELEAEFGLEGIKTASTSKKVVRAGNTQSLIKDTLEWMSQFPEKRRPSFKKKENKKPAVSGFRLREYIYPKGILVLLALLLLPYAFLLVSLFLLLISANLIMGAKVKAAEPVFLVSNISSSASYAQFSLYSKIPFLGEAFLGSKNLANLARRGSSLGLAGIRIFKDGSLLLGKVLGGDIYDPNSLSSEVSLGLDSFYRESGFLITEVENYSGIFGSLIKKIPLYKEAPGLREKVLQAKAIMSEFPNLTGAAHPTSYLILFQNNMELRPTGGFIGSFALATFDGGRLIDLNVADVYSADGQLKGHIEPPAPIKDYLGEANWFLRDSNWDPDFPISAARAEWFLEKEIDKRVDGVIGVDLELIKNLLTVTGPIALSDFNEVIDDGNLYQKTQSEAESDFFPGSYKKTNFLTALSRQLLTRISDAQEKEYLPISLKMLSGLEERHVQIFLHNKPAQGAFSSLGFDGGVKIPTCTGNCYSDWLGLIDANVGVNKANYFLERSASLVVYLDGKNLKRFLSVSLKNSASPTLGEAGRYKNYLRVLLPQGSSVNDVEVTTGNTKESEVSEITEIKGRKEVGVLFEVGPGQTKEVTFSWEEVSWLDLGKEGEYRLYIRKQAGTIGDKLSLTFFLPQGLGITTSPKLSLTPEDGYGYNTLLTRDFFSRISWPNE